MWGCMAAVGWSAATLGKRNLHSIMKPHIWKADLQVCGTETILLWSAIKKKKKKVILFLEKLLSLKLIDLFFDMENSVSPYHYCHGAAHSSVLLKYTCHVRPLLTFTQQHFCFTGIAKCSGTLWSSDATGQCYNLCLQTPMQSLLQHLCGHRGQSRHPWSYFCRNVVDTAVIFAIFKPFWESSVRITHCCRIGGGAFM